MATAKRRRRLRLEAARRPQHAKKRKTTPAAARAAALPDELLAEVLLRLPARALARLRATCRSWDAEISSRGFQERHHALAAARLAFLPPTPPHTAWAQIWVPESTRPAARPVMLPCRGCPRVTSSKPCGGLVLVVRPCRTTGPFSVCNPTTGEILHLPPPPRSPASFTTGFGFHAPAGEYKVVQVGVDQLGKVHCTVLVVGDSRGWRSPAAGVPQATLFDDFTEDTSIDSFVEPVFAGGCLHWSFLTDDRFLDKPHGVLSFSLADESFRRAPLPPFTAADLVPYDRHGERPNHEEQLMRTLGVRSGSDADADEEVALPVGRALAELDGVLCLVRDVRHRGHVAGMFEIWKLRDYDAGSWSLEMRVDPAPLPSPGHMADERLTAPWLVFPLDYVDPPAKGGRRSLLLTTTAQEAHVYDPETGILHTVASAAGCRRRRRHRRNVAPADLHHCLRLVLYKESIARLPGMARGNIKFVQIN